MKWIILGLVLVLVPLAIWALTRPIPWHMRVDDPGLYLMFRDFSLENGGKGRLEISDTQNQYTLVVVPCLLDDWSVDMTVKLEGDDDQFISLSNFFNRDQVDAAFDVKSWTDTTLRLVSTENVGALNTRKCFAIVQHLLGMLSAGPTSEIVVRQRMVGERWDGISRGRTLREQDLSLPEQKYVYWEI